MENHYGRCSVDNCVLPATHQWHVKHKKKLLICWECARLLINTRQTVSPLGFHARIRRDYLTRIQGKPPMRDDIKPLTLDESPLEWSDRHNHLELDSNETKLITSSLTDAFNLLKDTKWAEYVQMILEERFRYVPLMRPEEIVTDFVRYVTSYDDHMTDTCKSMIVGENTPHLITPLEQASIDIDKRQTDDKN